MLEMTVNLILNAFSLRYLKMTSGAARKTVDFEGSEAFEECRLQRGTVEQRRMKLPRGKEQMVTEKAGAVALGEEEETVKKTCARWMGSKQEKILERRCVLSKSCEKARMTREVADGPPGVSQSMGGAWILRD